MKSQDKSLPPFRSWESEEKRLEERQKLKAMNEKIEVFIKRKKDPLKIASISLFLPGYGHFSVNKKTKGIVYLTSSVISLGGAFFFLNLSNNCYNQYKNADNIDDIEKYWNESERYLVYAEITAGLASAIWILNVLDSYFTVGRYNGYQFEKLYHGRSIDKISPFFGLNSEGAQIKLVYTF